MLSYNFIVRLAALCLPVASLFSKKIRTWRNERKDNLKRLIDFKKSSKQKVIWIHCASHGEYEQVVPLLRFISQKQDCAIAVTFFSPSGFRHMKTYGIVAWKGYLPLDRKKDIEAFIDVLQPHTVLIVKNEFWWNTLIVLQEHGIPYHWVYMDVRQDQYFIKRPKPFYAQLLEGAASISTVSNLSKELLNSVYPNLDPKVCLDGKYIQAWDTKNEEFTDPFLTDLKGRGKPIIIYGSIWMEDIDQLLGVLKNPAYIHVLFPHDLSESNIGRMSNKLQTATLVKSTPIKNENTIYIYAKMGILKHAYRYANIAYVGGAYGEGIHNTLEAAIYDIPVFCGPMYTKSSEASFLVEQNIMTSVRDTRESEEFVSSFSYTPLSQILEIDRGSIEKQYHLIFSQSTQHEKS